MKVADPKPDKRYERRFASSQLPIPALVSSASNCTSTSQDPQPSTSQDPQPTSSTSQDPQPTSSTSQDPQPSTSQDPQPSTSQYPQPPSGHPRVTTLPSCMPASGWGKKLNNLPEFSDINIKRYTSQSGKKAKESSSLSSASVRKQTCIKYETRGYTFYKEGFLHDIWCRNMDKYFLVKAKCFASQRKNADPHTLHVFICMSDPCDVFKAYCTCKAGKSGFCNHLIALLHQIRDYSQSKANNIPDDKSKTSTLQTWHKPRIEGITPEPVMDCVAKKIKLESKCAKVVDHKVNDIRSEQNIANDPELIKTVQEKLAAENPLYGFAYMATPDHENTQYVKTCINTNVPRGSFLSYQMSLSEANFNVYCSENTLDKFNCTKNCNTKDMSYPPMPLGCSYGCPDLNQLPDKEKEFLLQIVKTKDQCSQIESETRDQRDSDLWWEKRQNILTASNFGEIYRRKKKKCDELLERLQARYRDTENLPASLKFGIQYENTAARKYKKYMSNIQHDVQELPCGLVTRPDIPFLGATPDGKIVDPVSHPHFGLLEIKCSPKYKNVAPRDAAEVVDRDFCLESHGGVPVLKRSHKYYAQVQGQMAICGAQWCDFVVYTFKGMFIERIQFDECYWNEMYEKLKLFYYAHFLPNRLTG